MAAESKVNVSSMLGRKHSTLLPRQSATSDRQMTTVIMMISVDILLRNGAATN